MKRLIVVMLALVAGGAAFCLSLMAPVQIRDPYLIQYTVAPGESFGDVCRMLRSQGVVRSAEALRVWGRLRGTATQVQAGYYEASSSEWSFQILNRMVRGDTQDTTVTVIEGMWLTEIGALVDPLVAGGGEAFVAAARDSVLLAAYGVPGDSLEGYLFPSTYRFGPGTPAESLVRQMTDHFFSVWDQNLAGPAAQSSLDRHELVTLASIVEAEARVHEERPRIAAVYLNRLDLGRHLQADPTVVYGLGMRKKRLLYADLEDRSPYNTYRVTGLPPGPIGNPSLASLQAVVSPCATCDDLYFVARGDGTHLFARTYEDHQANRRRVAREKRAQEGS